MEDQRLIIHAVGASYHHFHLITNDTIKRESNAILHYSITPLLQYRVYLLLHSQLSMTLSWSHIFHLGGVLCGIT